MHRNHELYFQFSHENFGRYSIDKLKGRDIFSFESYFEHEKFCDYVKGVNKDENKT